VLKWIGEHPLINDFSTEVLPHFIGGIATWKNKGIHKDIGAFSMLRLAQSDQLPISRWPKADAWQKKFLINPIHHQISKILI